MAAHHVAIGSLGVVIRIQIKDRGGPVDLGAGGTVEYQVVLPDGTAETWTPTIDDITTGQTSYITVTDDLDQAGVYTITPEVTMVTPSRFFPGTDVILVAR